MGREPVDPDNASLRRALDGAREVLVYAGGSSGNRPLTDDVLFRSTDSNDLDSLVDALQIVEDPATFGVCMCLGNPTLVVRPRSGSRTVIGVHHGHSIRWSGWTCNGTLEDGTALANWLDARGMPGLRREMEDAAERAEQNSQDYRRWIVSVPDCLRSLWDRVADDALASGGTDSEPFADALEAAIPDIGMRVRVLLRWYGSGVGLWSGYPSYEALPREVLETIPDAEVVAAVSGLDPVADPRIAEGTARYLVGWSARRRRKIPGELAARLLTHVERNPGDAARLRVARRAFVERATGES